MLGNNTWNHLTIHEQTSFNSFRNKVIYKVFPYTSYIYIYIYIYIYKHDLELDNPQELISHKTQPTNHFSSHFSEDRYNRPLCHRFFNKLYENFINVYKTFCCCKKVRNKYWENGESQVELSCRSFGWLDCFSLNATQEKYVGFSEQVNLWSIMKLRIIFFL